MAKADQLVDLNASPVRTGIALVVIEKRQAAKL